MVGILTEMDILRRLELGAVEVGRGARPRGSAVKGPGTEPGFHLKSLSEALEAAGDLTVANLMTSPVETAGPEDLVRDKVTLMVHRRIRRIPVVDGTGVLVGILSRKDLIRMLDGTAAGEGTGSRAIPPLEKKKAGRADRGNDRG